MSKPTVALFPGAFHPRDCFDRLEPELQSRGYTTLSVALASTGSTKGIQDDIDLIRGTVSPLLEQGKDVVVVLHSFAGFVGSAAIQDLKLTGVIYMCAFIPPSAGLSAFDLQGGQWQGWHQPDYEAGLLYAGDPVQTFFQDCPANEAQELASKLKGQSLAALTEKLPCIGHTDEHFNGRRAYIRCTQDAALVPPLQDQLLQVSGVQWIVKDIDTGHGPFLAKPKELAGILDEVMEEFRKPKP